MAFKRPTTRSGPEPRIFILRGRRIVLEFDLARIDGVTTSRFNEAFKRNRRRFPVEFVFQTTVEEAAGLRSQIAISSSESEGSHGGRRYRPWAFRGRGAIMAANILRRDRAMQMSVYVVRAFVRLREHIAENQAILKRLAEIDKTLLEHDVALRDFSTQQFPFLNPPEEETQSRRIGFQKEAD